MKEFVDFLQQLSANNNKPWFDAHKDEYKAVKEKFEAFALEFMHGVEAFDERVRNLTIKDITYRIYRDIRFSPDKRPYKDWMGVYVCPKGKKSGMAGCYIHFEPGSNTFFICAGLYNPTKEVLQSVREEIMLEPDKFHDAVMACGEGFQLSWENALKRIPQGYNESDKHSEYYRLKDYSILKPVTRKEILSKDFLSKALVDLQKCRQFNELLNQCYDYAYDID